MKPNYLEIRIEKNEVSIFYKIKQWFKNLFLKSKESNTFEVENKEEDNKNIFAESIKVDNGIETRRRKNPC